MPFKPGQLLAEKYEVDSLIGVGGISFVVAALHRGLESQVALKFLRPEFARHPEATRRFVAEAKSNFKLRSEHIVRVLDVDRLAHGAPFMVMERLSGLELRALIADRRVLPLELAVDFALQACEALATAHAARVIHRDIKPENLFLTRHADRPDQLKLLDFGICREVLTLDHRDQRIVTTEAVGSPPYMSPEQVRGAPDIDARSDIWSLGCVLYEMLSGRALFQRPSQAEGFAAVLEAPYVPLREFLPDMPPALDEAVARCLEKLPEQRFQSVAELADALVPFAPAHAFVHAARCSQLLDELAERKSGVQLMVRSRETPTELVIHTPELGPDTSKARGERKAFVAPFALVLSVLALSTLGWLRFAGDAAPSSRPARAPSGQPPASAIPTQQQVGPIEVTPLAVAEEPAPARALSPNAQRARGTLEAPKVEAARAARVTHPALPLLPTYLPKPDPYVDPAPSELPAPEPDVGF